MIHHLPGKMNATDAPDSLRDKQVLIVDDNQDLCRSLTMLLESHDMHVKARHNATDAKQSFKEDDFDLIILDVMLDDADGFDLFVYLRNEVRDTQTPVLFLSALFEPKHSKLLNRGTEGKARVMSKSDINRHLLGEIGKLLQP